MSPRRRPPVRATEETIPVDRVIRLAAFRKDLRAFLRHSEHVSRKWRLTPQRYLLLLVIKGAPDGSGRLSFSDIAHALSLSPNTVTELGARAESAGLVKREPSDEDLRVVYLRLTPEGERRLMGAIAEGESSRRELQVAFDELSATFRSSTRAGRSRERSAASGRTR